MSTIRLYESYYGVFGIDFTPDLIRATEHRDGYFSIIYAKDGTEVEVRGSGAGFQFDALGELSDATRIDSAAFYVNGQLGLSVTGINKALPAEDVINGTNGFLSEAFDLDGNDNVYLTGKNDTWYVSRGSDVVEGGAGLDTFYIGEDRADVTILGAARHYLQFRDNDQSEDGFGYELAYDFERFIFNDGILAFDLDGNAGQAYRLYQAAFDRVPDPEGLGYWIGELDAEKGGLAWVANNFIISEEFKETYGTAETVSNTAFMTLLYNNVLDRDPDAEGLSYWLAELARGFERERVLASFSESVENKANVADAIKEGIWYTYPEIA